MIDRSHPLSVKRQAELLNISRGAVYYLPKPTSQRDLVLMNAMDRLHLDFPFMGSRQLRSALRRQGHDAGRLRIRTLMRKMGISALAPQPGNRFGHRQRHAPAAARRRRPATMPACRSKSVSSKFP